MSQTAETSRPNRRVAVVLTNLGGPDGPDAVKPFLFNLFNDPAIIGLPGIVRTPLARLISSRREKSAQANYARMGGGSPLLPETLKQAAALSEALADAAPGDETEVFIAMRYWHPLTEDTARAVAEFQPDHVVLLPLYPQFSTTTTASSLKAWREAYKGSGELHAVCCYPDAEGLIEAQARLIRETMDRAEGQPVRVLFSAHGIPEKLVAAGDPYQAQVEATVAAVVARMGLTDWAICYQSRVGPMKWLGPATPEAIEQAGRDGVGAVVVPIAFVSEHIETLVELDHEYAELAEQVGCAPYLRTPAVGVEPAFIAALAQAVESALETPGVAPQGLSRGGPCAHLKACPGGCSKAA
ncbi:MULTISPECIES: ferrochelatase [unclassified Brevundimonas]|uniref:ferrochelatase n=1 Tax=unclassified Brevundimonas TaxID=2622653 RepID=UPI000CFD4F32|nr:MULTISPECIES: ferrochelatase [unclassified Brevundimonas]PRA36570.1 ferrochelatase [Brevundimonas sp. MYb27]PQZ78652.1 ferrochelatase [Brevundimonas sp. MYb31]PRB13570.1 ferrochelatase [Brevundimonas sp. MYb52]PRB34214.1 ferrochelatase [Brevundimonas sp. MYb46]PRB46608.1 ferrochelatase [Brevundimonas sp. MYb33]